MRKTLFDRLTPIAREQLESEHKTYEFSVNTIYDTLKSKQWWSDLTVTEVSRFLLYTNASKIGVDIRDYMTIMYGTEKLIEPQNELI